MKNKQAREMIERCINDRYGHDICEWRYGRLMRKYWAGRRHKQGVFIWYGCTKKIK